MIESLIGTIAIVALIIVVVRQNSRIGLLEREIGALRSFVLAKLRPRRGAEGGCCIGDASRSPRSSRRPTRPSQKLAAVTAEAAPAETPAEPGPWAVAASSVRGTRRRRPKPQPSPSPTKPAAAKPAPKKPDIETALGTRWAVWVGGLALALGGLFLIRYSIEAGIFGPGVRLTMAGLLGLVLVGGGEFIRRTGFKVPVEGAAGAYVPGILTAAGAFTLFGTVYAAHGIYGFIGPAFGLPAARRHRRRHDRGGARAWPGAGRHRPARLDDHAGAGLVAVAERLGAVRLSGDRACRQHRDRAHARLEVPRRGRLRRHRPLDAALSRARRRSRTSWW